MNYKTILPGEEFSWSFAPKYPGAFMYHCGTPPVLMHIGTGMYGAMIVDPKDGWPEAQELVFVQSDFYLMDGENGIKVPDYTKMLGHGNMDYVVFNGHANSVRRGADRGQGRRADPDLPRQRRAERLQHVPRRRRHLRPGLRQCQPAQRALRTAVVDGRTR